MVVKVYISGISGNKEVKKRQQRVLLILDSKNVEYLVIDIAEPGAEESKDFMQNNSTAKGATISDPDPRHPLPPQIFNENEYCGDYDMFDMANEIDEMEKFLKFEVSDTKEETATAEIKLKNGEVTNDEKPEEPKENDVSNEQETPKETEESENGAGDAAKLENGNEDAADKENDAEEKAKSKEPSPAKSKEPSPEKEEAGEKSKEPSPEKSKEPSPEKSEEKSKESSPEKADD